MKKKLSASSENYLKAIYYLSQKEESVKSADIAALLGVSKASVNTAMKKLSCDGLVQKELYGQVFLTPAGRDQALAVIKKYVVIFSLLVEVLSVDRSIGAQDAGMIEHMVSDESIKAIDEFLTAQKIDARKMRFDFVPVTAGHFHKAGHQVSSLYRIKRDLPVMSR